MITQQLNNTLRALQKFWPSKKPLGVLVRHETGAAVFEATDGTMAASVPLAYDGEPFDPAIVQTPPLLDVLPPGNPITAIETGADVLRIMASGYEASIPATAGAWPAWPEQGDMMASFKTAALREALLLIKAALPRVSANKGLAQAHLEFGMTGAKVVATNGFDMAVATIGHDDYYEAHSKLNVNLSPEFVGGLFATISLLSVVWDRENVMMVSTPQDGVVLFTNGARVIGRDTGYAFPEWEGVVTSATDKATARALLDMGDLYRALRVLLRGAGKNKPVRIEVGPNALHLRAYTKGALVTPSVPAMVYGPEGYVAIADLFRTHALSKCMTTAAYMHYNPDDYTGPLVWKAGRGMVVSMPYIERKE